tara:strand:+ start:3607 stop:4116 length:510 start_codon:yes stop_codon:yes gene_type:complete
MSTPTATLPKNTDNKKQDRNDINDPLVQDVLNEFRDEYSSNNKNNNGGGGEMLTEFEDIVEFPPDENYHSRPMQYRKSNYNMPDNYYNNQPHQHNRTDSHSYLNIDIEIVKKNLTIVIIVLLIHNTGIMAFIYEKMPEYLHENLNAYDIAFKSMLLFIVLYILNILHYI